VFLIRSEVYCIFCKNGHPLRQKNTIKNNHSEDCLPSSSCGSFFIAPVPQVMLHVSMLVRDDQQRSLALEARLHVDSEYLQFLAANRPLCLAAVNTRPATLGVTTSMLRRIGASCWNADDRQRYFRRPYAIAFGAPVRERRAMR
jgi:hypothetical protein